MTRKIWRVPWSQIHGQFVYERLGASDLDVLVGNDQALGRKPKSHRRRLVP